MRRVARDEVFAAVADLRARLERRFGERLADMRLYGSYARGEEHEESDVDVLVVVTGLTWEERRQVSFTTADVYDEHDGVPLSTVAFSMADWQHLVDRERLLALDVARDGIPI